VNRDTKQGETPQWVNVTLLQEDDYHNEIKITCGKFNIFVGLDFNPTLLGEVLKVVSIPAPSGQPSRRIRALIL